MADLAAPLPIAAAAPPAIPAAPLQHPMLTPFHDRAARGQAALAEWSVTELDQLLAEPIEAVDIPPPVSFSVDQNRLIDRIGEVMLAPDYASVIGLGTAGSGKTASSVYARQRTLHRMLLNKLYKTLEEAEAQHVHVASTNKMASQLEIATINKFLGIGLTPTNADAVTWAIIRGKGVHRILRLKSLMIEECAMLPRHFWLGLNKAAQILRKCPDQPFGGIRMIFIGDPHQLGPVDSNQRHDNMKRKHGGAGRRATPADEVDPELFTTREDMWRHITDTGGVYGGIPVAELRKYKLGMVTNRADVVQWFFEGEEWFDWVALDDHFLLKVAYRQKDDTSYAELLYRLCRNELTEADRAQLNARCLSIPAGKEIEYIRNHMDEFENCRIIAPTHKVCRAVSDLFYQRNPNPAYHFEAIDVCPDPTDQWRKTFLRQLEAVSIKKGMRMVLTAAFTPDNSAKVFPPGTVGEVVDVVTETIDPDTTETITLAPSDWYVIFRPDNLGGHTIAVTRYAENIEDNHKRVLYTRRQIPLICGRVHTIHFVQGMTITDKLVFFPDCFADGQFNTAATRVQNLQQLVIMGAIPYRSILISAKVREWVDGVQMYLDHMESERAKRAV